jgi:hypothetical protein
MLSAGTPALLAPDDRRKVCKVAVDETYGSPALQQSVASNPVGGPAAGAACSAASMSHPNAGADFARLLHEAASAGSLKQALEAGLNLPRAECPRAQGYGTANAAPDTIIEIQKVDVAMGCAFGRQEYRISVKWRTLATTDRRVLGEKTTRCWQTSSRDIDAWFADPDRARTEIEQVLARTGQRMGAELLSPGGMYECKFRSGKSGGIEDR